MEGKLRVDYHKKTAFNLEQKSDGTTSGQMVHAVSGWKSAKGRCLVSPLPEGWKTTRWWPFGDTVIDCFGSLLLGYGKQAEKRYVWLVTGMKSWAFSPDGAHSMSTDSIFQALQRMTERQNGLFNIYSGKAEILSHSLEYCYFGISGWSVAPRKNRDVWHPMALQLLVSIKLKWSVGLFDQVHRKDGTLID